MVRAVVGSCRSPSVPRPAPCPAHAKGQGAQGWAAMLGARQVPGGSPLFGGNTQERGGRAGASLPRWHPGHFWQLGTGDGCHTAAAPGLGSRSEGAREGNRVARDEPNSDGQMLTQAALAAGRGAAGEKPDVAATAGSQVTPAPQPGREQAMAGLGWLWEPSPVLLLGPAAGHRLGIPRAGAGGARPAAEL